MRARLFSFFFAPKNGAGLASALAVRDNAFVLASLRFSVAPRRTPSYVGIAGTVRRNGETPQMARKPRVEPTLETQADTTTSTQEPSMSETTTLQSAVDALFATPVMIDTAAEDAARDSLVIEMPASDERPATISFKWTELPLSTQFRLAKGGASHMLGNEVAAQVVGLIRKALGQTKDNKISTDQIKAYRAANPDQVQAWRDELTLERIKSIREGTLADRAITSREPARSPVDNIAMGLLAAKVEENYRNHKAKITAQGNIFNYTAKDVSDMVRSVMTSPEKAEAWAKYRAAAQAQLDAAKSSGDEDEFGLAA